MPIKTGRIYRIVCLPEPDIQYVGSTFNELRHRWQNHCNHYSGYLDNKNTGISIYKYFDKYDIDNFKIILIKEYQVYQEHNKDRKHLQAYEQLWINKINCVNINNTINIPYLSSKLYNFNNSKIQSKNKKEYYEKHKHILSEKKKIYRIKNKEKIKNQSQIYTMNNKEKTKKYRETNKEKIKKHKARTYICPCFDKPLTCEHKTRHELTKRHINFFKIS